MMNKNLNIWIALVVMTLLSYFSSESPWGNYAVIVLVLIVIIKCSMVGFGFMELSKAHKFWQAAFLFLVMTFSLFVMVVILM